MAFDLKAATPDASFPTGGFLFGADSQAATDPSIYSEAGILAWIRGLAHTWLATQTITPAVNTNALAVTGYSLTGANAQSLIDLAGTWNTTGAPTAIKLNITNTASDAASKLLDLQVGGSSMVAVLRTGQVSSAYTGTDPAFTNNARTHGLGFPADAYGAMFINNTMIQRWTSSAGFWVNNGLSIGWASDTGAADIMLARDAAGVLAQRNGTNAQTFRSYFSYTDASNYTRLALKTATTLHTIETESAGTGEANIDLALTPKGTGRVRYGTHSALAAETVTGYITIKDSGGTERKLAVVS